MASKFRIKRGDTLPVLRVALTVDDAVVDLTAATEVKFFFKLGSAVAIERIATVEVPETNGIVSYQFELADWADFEVATYRFEAQATFAGGDVVTIPTKTYNTVIVVQDLAD